MTHVPIHPDADLKRLAFHILVRAIKDVIAPPKGDPVYNHDRALESMLAWTEHEYFWALCVLADLDIACVTRLIQYVCGVDDAFPDSATPRHFLSIKKHQHQSGVDVDTESFLWNDE